MLSEFLTFIREQSLFEAQDKILLAVSGGIDSVVMSDLFNRAGFYFAIAHCNFGLRGPESDGDEQFVVQLAQQYGLAAYTNFFDTPAFARQSGISLQMAARQLRYEWLETLRSTEGYDYIATAHQLNDCIETLLFNLSRGTGIAGLSGIRSRQGRVIRPLLFADRESVAQYARQHQISWREDSSNRESKYARNLIRHQVVPVLKKLNPNLESTTALTMERLAATERLFQASVAALRDQLEERKEGGIYLWFEKLENWPEPLLHLSHILEYYGFSYRQVRTIWDSRHQ
ncbi:MAG: tRNA lysidine(34) synthetase TilS, partial [Bacteroidia bacterium]|nr:tRNA lysidine(34) synthetase TilS [Bacteroidia bacterium]